MAESAVSAVVFPDGVRTCMKSPTFFIVQCKIPIILTDKSHCLNQGEFAGCDTFMTDTYTQTAILPTGLTFPWSSKSFSMGSHLIRKGLTDFISPSALYWRVCVWWLAWRVDRNRTSRQWHCRVYRVIPFRAELKAIALYPRSNFCSQNDQRQMWELQLFNQSESSSP